MAGLSGPIQSDNFIHPRMNATDGYGTVGSVKVTNLYLQPHPDQKLLGGLAYQMRDVNFIAASAIHNVVNITQQGIDARV
jgi:hypothetical protein